MLFPRGRALWGGSRRSGRAPRTRRSARAGLLRAHAPPPRPDDNPDWRRRPRHEETITDSEQTLSDLLQVIRAPAFVRRGAQVVFTNAPARRLAALPTAGHAGWQVVACRWEGERAELLVACDEATPAPGLERRLRTEVQRSRRDGTPLMAVRVDFPDGRRPDDLAAVSRLLRSTDYVSPAPDAGLIVLLPRTRPAEAGLVCGKLRAGWPTRTPLLRLCAVPEGARVADLLALLESSGPIGPSDYEPREAALAWLRATSGVAVLASRIVGLQSEEVVGWRLAVRGPSGPYEGAHALLDLALEAGLATHADLVCFKACLRAAQGLPGAADIRVPLLPSTLLDSDRPRLGDLLGTAPGVTGVELNERFLVGDPGEVRPGVKLLQKRGYTVTLADIGYGRSSLEALMALAPDFAVLRAELVAGLDGNTAVRRPVGRLIKLLRSVGTACVAPAIASPRQFEELRQLGVPYGTGPLFGAPVELEAARA